MSNATVFNLATPLRTFTVLLTPTLLTTGSPADITSAAIPAGITRWKPIGAYVRASSAAATLALATVGLYTQAAAAGTLLVTPVLLTSLSAAQKLQDFTVIAVTDAIADQNIFVRQTVNSGAAGALVVVVNCINLS